MTVRVLASMLVLAGVFCPAGGAALMAAVPPNGGTIAIEPKLVGEDDPAVAQPFVDAAREALAARGFTVLPDPAHAAYAVALTITRTDSGTASAKVAAGKADVSGGAMMGAGAGVTVPLASGTRLVPLLSTRLEMRMIKRGESDPVWTGVATTVRSAGARQGAEDRVATDLSAAILRSYPAEPDGVVGVP